MPQGTGTYGSKVGRPVKMKTGGLEKEKKSPLKLRKSEKELNIEKYGTELPPLKLRKKEKKSPLKLRKSEKELYKELMEKNVLKMRRGGMRGGVGYDSPGGKIRLHEEKKRRSTLRKAAKEDPISREDIAGPVKRKSAPVKKAKQKITGKGAIRTKDGQLNVTTPQIDKLGMSLTQYVNYHKKHGKRPTALVTTGPESGDISTQPVTARKVIRKPGRARVDANTSTRNLLSAPQRRKRDDAAGRVTREPIIDDKRKEDPRIAEMLKAWENKDSESIHRLLTEAGVEMSPTQRNLIHHKPTISNFTVRRQEKLPSGTRSFGGIGVMSRAKGGSVSNDAKKSRGAGAMVRGLIFRGVF